MILKENYMKSKPIYNIYHKFREYEIKTGQPDQHPIKAGVGLRN